ncbi:hypothetical protein MTR_1g040605 [Medicago truncatula]|uniref:Uncharacterized protein n=1 Tax=Medicago truncatula TaxID=3880 RepID=G7ZZP6_MEDTR|nr:hypothetical protein MTR_1g040605 [Medicago truncatula]
MSKLLGRTRQYTREDAVQCREFGGVEIHKLRETDRYSRSRMLEILEKMYLSGCNACSSKVCKRLSKVLIFFLPINPDTVNNKD